MRILVCEDHDSIRQMIEALVKARGFQVVGVNTGAKAIEHALDGGFDLLLLDLMLPGTYDGIAVCQRLRADEKTKDLPIYIISAMDDDASRARVKEAGATAFYSKPFRPTELLKELDKARERLKENAKVPST